MLGPATLSSRRSSTVFTVAAQESVVCSTSLEHWNQLAIEVQQAFDKSNTTNDATWCLIPMITPRIEPRVAESIELYSSRRRCKVH